MTTPSVSVLIRTIGRDTLSRSVSSALSQTHRPFELVIANAATNPLPPLPEANGVDIRLVEAAGCNRPRAANVALDHARGQWLIFLDDDDAFEPDHVASLLESARLADAGVAYSATQCIDEAGRNHLVMGAAFDRLHLFQGNYIQLGAGLFRAELVGENVRFDEDLDCLQDWDFWIQLAQRTHFAYSGRSTNIWSAYSGSSGAGLGANQRDDVTQPFRYRIRRKWAAHANRLQGKLRHHRDAASSAMARGNEAAARRHLASVERLRSGPVDTSILHARANAR